MTDELSVCLERWTIVSRVIINLGKQRGHVKLSLYFIDALW